MQGKKQTNKILAVFKKKKKQDYPLLLFPILLATEPIHLAPDTAYLVLLSYYYSSHINFGISSQNSVKVLPLVLEISVSSVAQSCPTLCDPLDYSTEGSPVHHQLLELAQPCVHQVSDVIQPSHPLLSPSPTAFSLSQHQGLFQ